ncbi:MAG: ankyrin repeat domain-containing protein [Parachlamydiaceae bacterium]|nr:ankyrin repeat domain-containing protein [Parachlamydiaceae bacterium]
MVNPAYSNPLSYFNFKDVESLPIINTITPPFDVLVDGVETGDLLKVKEAFKRGADANGIWETQNILHCACEKGNVEIVRELLENGAGIDSKSWRMSDTPLHRACIFGHAEVVKYLITQKATINIRSKNCGMTPLEYAITSDSLKCCELLIRAGALVNDENIFYGRTTPLKEACSKLNYDMVKLLLDSGAEPKVNLSTVVNSPKILQLLLNKGASVNSYAFFDDQSPLFAAATWGRVESVIILLAAGADPKVIDDEGKTPLDRARWHLNNHQTNPCNSPEITANFIQNLEVVINILSSSTLSK